MVRVSNGLLGSLNIITLLVSLPVIGTGVWFRVHGASACERALQWPIIALGLFLLLVSLMGLLGSCCRVSLLLWAYLFVLFLLILAMFCFAAFAFVVTNRGVGEAISGKGFREYRLGDYSHWLQRRVARWDTWKRIESCLRDAELCGGLRGEVGLKADEFYNHNLSPMQSGCCKPPTYCGFVYKNATFWVAPKSGLKTSDADCKAWSNDQDKLCYDCNSCKSGVLATIKNKWKEVSIFNVALLIFLIIVYSIGCCAIRNNRADNQYKRYYGYR